MPSPTPQVEPETPIHPSHPRVIEVASDDGVTITILPPRNPLRVDPLTSLIFAAMGLACAAILIVTFKTRGIGGFFLAMFACMLAWLAAELPDLVRGLHTRVELAVHPDELRATTRYAWTARTTAYRRDRVLGVRIVSPSVGRRALHVRFKDAEPLEIMTGYPAEHLDAAAASLRRALDDVAPTTPVLHADDVATLPYAGAGASYEIEILRLADGVNVTIPPPPRNTVRALGQLLFAAMWLTMFASLLPVSWRALWWCPVVPLILIGGTWGLVVATRAYLNRNAPLLIALTPTELVIENGPWIRRTRRVPRSEIKSIAMEGSGQLRTMVLAITAKRRLELMPERETDEIERVAAALSEAL